MKNTDTASRFLALAPIAFAAFVGACTTTTSSHPTDTSTQDVTNARNPNGSSSDSDAGSPTPTPAPAPVACPVTSDNASCASCIAKQCQKTCNTCTADAQCSAALSCVLNCSDSSCVDACVSGLSTTAMNDLDAMLGNDGCVYTTCGSECSTPGKIGDACSSDSQCGQGSCNGGWCTETCTSNVQCGVDTAGQLVWCVKDQANESTCFPGCSSNADCAPYPGTTCQAVTAVNGATGHVCSL